MEESAIDEQVEELRNRVATLETVERRPRAGDQVVVDYVGTLDGEPFEGGTGRDQLIELGSGNLIPGFEEQLLGASAGDVKTVEVTFPDDYPSEELAGQAAAFEVTVHEVKAKRLPELDDDLAAEASEFDTLDELREDFRKRLAEADERTVEREFEEAVLQAVTDNAEVDVPEGLVHARAHELIDQTLSALARQGISKETYLQLSGKSEHELADEAEPEAAAALRREAVLAAVVEAEAIDPTEEQLQAALEPVAHREGVDAAELVERLRKNGRLEELREDVATRQALELLVSEAKPISSSRPRRVTRCGPPARTTRTGRIRGQARGSSGQLWTPGS